MPTYIILTALLIVLILGYFKLANHFNIIDKPNHRSSHSIITIRGGGILFPVAAILWFLVYGFSSPLAMAGLVIMAVVSFLDDINPLSSKVRILAHLIAVSLLFLQLQLFGLPWLLILFAYIFTIGWINAFNFMDGINGITALYSLVGLSTFYYLNHSIHFVPNDLILLLTISVLIFLFFNARKKAKTFAGDVGSVSMAFLLAWFMVSLMLKTGRVEYILCFAVYGIDSVVTILFRLVRKENIFEAHRSHLYQYLSNELQWPHVVVSGIYSISQLAINALTIWLLSSEKMNWITFSGLFIFLTLVYLLVRLRVQHKIHNY